MIPFAMLKRSNRLTFELQCFATVYDDGFSAFGMRGIFGMWNDLRIHFYTIVCVVVMAVRYV